MGRGMSKVFFGQLRPAEIEVSSTFNYHFNDDFDRFLTLSLVILQHLIEKSWYAVTETCLAFTVFRDDFSPKFVALFTLLLFLKSFHWLAEDRIDYVSQHVLIKPVHVRKESFIFRWSGVLL